LSPRKRKLAFWKAQRDSVRKEEEQERGSWLSGRPSEIL